jgi:hypothetical protein
MQIVPGKINAGSIIVNDKIPSLNVGRTLIATVLSNPRGSHILVSLFGRKVLVETTIPLQKGQVLNLKVHAISPRIILKPAEHAQDQNVSLKGLRNLVEQYVGTLGKVSVKSFTFGEIFKTLANKSFQDPGMPQFVSLLLEQINMHPQALAYLFIPLVEKDSHSHAQVCIEKNDDAYIIYFEITMETLGAMECTARLDDKIDVEIRTPSEKTAGFLKKYIHELKDSLEPMGVRTCEVVFKRLSKTGTGGVDVLV